MDAAGLKELLAPGPLLGDGGLGAALVDRGVSLDVCFEDLNRTDPGVVSEVHRSFAEAGARLVETNTFGANRFNLSKLGLADDVEELNRLGVEIARTAGVLVVGSVGPLRVHLAPYGRVTKAQAFEAYAEQIDALTRAGADLVFIETQSDLVEMEQALSAARSVTGTAVAVLATFTRDDRTLLGSTPTQVARRLVELGADAVGVNCSEGPAQVLRIAAEMRSVAGDVPVIAMPNAGGPSRVGTRFLYPATGDYFAEFARSAVAAGVSVVGGCCGTGPEHVRAMSAALAEPRRAVLEFVPSPPADDGEQVAAAPTKLGRALSEGRFVVCVEMEPPKGHSAARLVAGAETLQEAGADVIYVSDSSRARLRMSAWAACRLVQEHTGIETILGFPTRGRNLLRVQGDLLAAHALGIRHLFVCMGDPTSIGDYPGASDRSDITPSGLIALVTQRLNTGADQAGTSIGEPTAFVAGCALDLNTADPDRETGLLRRKIDAGADFALCQPIFSMDVLRTFRKSYEERYGRLDLPLVAGAWPLLNGRNAEYLHNEIPGITIPAEVRRRMWDAGEETEREGVRIAVDIASQLREEAAGVYICPPFRRYDLAAEVVDAVRA